MGFYRAEPVVSPSDDKNDFSTETVTIEENWVDEISVFFPDGQRNAVKVAVYFGDRQLFPSRNGNFVGGDGFTRTGPIRVELEGKDPELEIRAFSDADNLDHEVLVDIKTLPVAAGRWRRNLARIASVFGNPGGVVSRTTRQARELISGQEDKSTEDG